MRGGQTQDLAFVHARLPQSGSASLPSQDEEMTRRRKDPSCATRNRPAEIGGRVEQVITSRASREWAL